MSPAAVTGRPSSSGPGDPPARDNPSGSLLFARFAHPPNALGLCGPDAADELWQRASLGADDAGLRALLRGFEGAWPYLELIAGSAGLADPLDPRAVEAYWIGNALLDRVDRADLGRSIEDRFRRRLDAPGWAGLSELLVGDAGPHHNLHVFGVYPWVGLLRGGRVAEPLAVLDQCRISWGRVVGVPDLATGIGATGIGVDSVVVAGRPLAWDGFALHLGPERVRTVRVGHDLDPLRAGDHVALHWDWACTRLLPRQLVALGSWTSRILAAVNGTAHPAPAAVLG